MTTIDGTSIRWLADTGAVISVMDEVIFEKLASADNRRRKPFVKMKDKYVELKGVTGHTFAVRGTYCLPIETQGKLCAHPVCIVKNLPSKAILGVDFLDAVQANIDFETRRIDIRGRQSELKLKREVILTPHTKMAVPVCLVNPIQGQQIPHLGLTSATSDSAVSIIEGLHLAVDGNTLLAVENTSDVEQRIPRGSIIAKWERCTSNVIAELKPVLKQNLSVHLVTKQKQIPLSETKRDLIQNTTKIKVQGSERKELLDLLMQYHDVISDDSSDIGGTDVISHKINLKNQQPVHCKQFRIPWSHREAIEKHVDNLLDKGCIEPSRSAFNAPLFCVQKPHDGGLRVVQDFRALNEASYEDKYIIREVKDCTDQIGLRKSKIFSTLDLTSGFWQQNLEKQSREYTAFTVPGRGRFQWTRTPMGLHGAPSSFARLMDFVMSNLDGVITYIDDLLVHSSTFDQHLFDLESALKRLRLYNLKLNLRKCEFGTDHVAYLGFTLTSEGVKPGEEKLLAVKNFPEPNSITKIREFTGLANYFRHMIKDYALIAGHLTTLLSKDNSWKGGTLPPKAKEAFNQLKKALCEAPVLLYPRGDRPFSLLTDAATGDQLRPGGLGAVLMQKDDKGVDRVVSYASRSLKKAEKNYSAFLLELAAAAWGIEHFRVYLAGRKFILYTDHKPLEKLSTRHKSTLNRLQDAMNEFQFIVKHKAGKENVIADALSRNPVDINVVDVESDVLPQCFTLKEFIKEQEKDDFVSSLKHELHDSRSSSLARNCFVNEQGVLCYILRRSHFKDRSVFVTPAIFRNIILQAAHSTRFSGHGGIFRTLTRILTQFWWPSLTADVEAFIKACEICQKSKNPPKFVQSHAPLQPLPIPSAPNIRVHLDLFGELKTSSKGKKFILVITDAFSKYTVLAAIENKSADTVAEAFYEKYLCIFGAPEQICSDRGKEFCNQILDKICKKWKIKRLKTSAMHPATNSSAESFNRTIIKYLTAMLEDTETLEWEGFLPALSFCYNTQIHKATLQTPFFLTYLREPNVPYFDFNQKDYSSDFASDAFFQLKYAYAMTRKHLESQADNMIRNSEATAKTKHFNIGDMVLVYFPSKTTPNSNAKFISSWTGPWKVLEILGKTTYLLQPVDHIHKHNSVVHVDRIKSFVPKDSLKQGRSPTDFNSSPSVIPSADDDKPALSVNSDLTYAQVCARSGSSTSVQPSNGASSPVRGSTSSSEAPPTPVLTRLQARQKSATVPEYPYVAPKPLEYK
jgi:transposase InsO family protein/ribonuclease HI